VTSLDTMPAETANEAEATDMQTLAVLSTAEKLGMAGAAMLIVSEARGELLGDEDLDSIAKRAGRAAAGALSNPKVEG